MIFFLFFFLVKQSTHVNVDDDDTKATQLPHKTASVCKGSRVGQQLHMAGVLVIVYWHVKN